MNHISPDDPRLPAAWRKQPAYYFQIATLVNSKDALEPDKDTAAVLDFLEPDEIRLERVFPGWFVSHDFKADEFDPFMDVTTPEDLDRVLGDLESLQRGYFEQAVDAMREFISNNDFRSAQGWLAKMFGARKGGFLTSEQRQQLIDQLQRTPSATSDPTVLRQAFLELERGVAVGAVLWQEIECAYLTTYFESPHNPVLTLIGREVVCEDQNFEEPTTRGELRLLEGNVLGIGDWEKDFSGFVVNGMPFVSAELDLEDTNLAIYEAEYYDLINEDDNADDDADES